METVKGFRDFSGEEALKRETTVNIISKNFKSYGFEPAETPIVEYEEFVRGNNTNDETVSDIYKLEDKGKRKLALRYEFTFQLKRLASNKKLPYKRYQIGAVFRDEPATSNRFRQFTQCDADIIGSTIKDEAEILTMADKIMKELGIKGIIYINNRKLLNEILEEQKIKQKEQVLREIDKFDKLSEKELKENLKKLDAEKILEILKKPESFFKKYNSYKEIEELKEYCEMFSTKIIFQPYLVRGLSYYNGSVFEIKTAEIKETIIAGGSYLVNAVQSTGISFGLDRISNVSEIKSKEDKYLIISIGQDKEAVKLAEKLREKEKAVNLFFGKVSKALDYANSYGIGKVIFLGEDEIKKKKLKIRDMKSGKEEAISEKELFKN
ncbi:MAG: ATP phosphoribosyltransferase regulatory subunit [Nanoarchaeota archaeon]|nr:ATP phosphoribosyltransferase regulatory subunit [Nanoarchaeota archaeon]